MRRVRGNVRTVRARPGTAPTRQTAARGDGLASGRTAPGLGGGINPRAQAYAAAGAAGDSAPAREAARQTGDGTAPLARPKPNAAGKAKGDGRGRRQKFGRHRKRRGGGASGHKDGVRQRAAHASHADLATEAATRAAARRAASRRQPEATSSPDARKKNGSGPPRPADIIRRTGATRKRPRATFQNCGRLGPSRRSRAAPPIFGARENIPPNAHDQGIWIRATYQQDAPALHGSVL